MKIVYIAPVYTEKVLGTRKITNEFSQGAHNKIYPFAEILVQSHELVFVATGYTKAFNFSYLKSHHETIRLGDSEIPIIYPSFFCLRYITFIFIALSIFHTCVRLKPDLIIYYNFRLETLIPAVLSKFFWKCKIICQFEDGYHISSNEFYLKKIIFNLIFCVGQHLTDGFTLVNSYLLNVFPSKKSKVIPFILDPKSSAIASNYKATYKLNEKNIVKIAYLGSLDNDRGVLVFLRAAQLLKDNTRLMFIIAGDGPASSEIKSVAIEQKNLKFLGFIPKSTCYEVMSDSDILVNPQLINCLFSKYSFPSKVKDYIELLKPIISSEFLDIHTVETTGVYYYKNDDPNHLARLIERLSVEEINLNYTPLFEKFGKSKINILLSEFVNKLNLV